MNTTYRTYGLLALMLIIGGVVGWSVRPMSSKDHNTHMMPDGHMMSGMSMDDMMHQMNANLAGKKGDTFDSAFIDEMIVHHQGAIDMALLAQTHAKHQEIKTLANAIIQAQTSEIKQMKDWKRAWYQTNE